MAEVAAVGWAISTLGWIASPITTRLLNHGFDLLGFDESEKLRDLEERLLPRLELMRQQADRIPLGQRGRVEKWARKLKSAFYDAEDILDVADYHRLEKQMNLQDGRNTEISATVSKLRNEGRVCTCSGTTARLTGGGPGEPTPTAIVIGLVPKCPVTSNSARISTVFYTS